MSQKYIKKLEDKIKEYDEGMAQQANRLAQAQQIAKEANEQIILMRGAKIGLEEQLADLRPKEE